MSAPQQLFVGGTWRDTSSGATHDVINSFSGEAVTTQAAAGVSDVDAAVDAAHATFPAWAATAPGERRAILEKAGELLTERAPDIARAMCEETAATFGVGMFNCALAAGMFAAAAVEAEAVMTAPVETAFRVWIRVLCVSRSACASASRRGMRR